MNEKEKFYLVLEHYQWHCGDGCCSDSGYQGALFYKEDENAEEEPAWNYPDSTKGYLKLSEWDNWNYTREEDIVRYALNVIKERHKLILTREDLNCTTVRSEENDEGERYYYTWN
jgi:hypothetical protein